VGERQDVLAPLAQGRYLDAHDLEPVVDVLAEGSLAHHRVEVAVRRRDDAHVDAAALRATHAADLVVLQHAQELDLKSEWDLADLVEEKRAARGRFEEAAVVAVGTGEGAPDVAEQLALEEVLRKRAAVDGDERPPRAA